MLHLGIYCAYHQALWASFANTYKYARDFLKPGCC